MSDHPEPHTSHSAQPPQTPAALRLLAITAVGIGVLVLAVAAFVLSYPSIHGIARQAGVSLSLARIYPVIFDAMLVIACAAVLSLRGAGLVSRCYAWLALLALLGAAAGAGALRSANVTLPHRQAAVAAAILPWALVLIGFGLLLAMLRHARLNRAAAAAAAAAAPPEPPMPYRSEPPTAFAALPAGKTQAAGPTQHPALGVGQLGTPVPPPAPAMQAAPTQVESPAQFAPDPVTPEPHHPSRSAPTPAGAAPSSTTPGSTAAGSTAPGSTAPASTAPASTAPASTALGSTAPAGAAPSSTAPASTAPASTKAASAKAASMAPASPPPASTAPGSTAPGSTAPGSTAPGSAPGAELGASAGTDPDDLARDVAAETAGTDVPGHADEAAPDETTPERTTAPERTAPERTTPERTTPERTAADKTAADKHAPGQNPPEEGAQEDTDAEFEPDAPAPAFHRMWSSPTPPGEDYQD